MHISKKVFGAALLSSGISCTRCTLPATFVVGTMGSLNGYCVSHANEKEQELLSYGIPRGRVVKTSKEDIEKEEF